MYLAGIVALFFLFAIITGVIVHWKKIIPNFYSFNPKTTLKRIWSDSHTALGILGLPFQFIFALTGAYFGLSVLVLAPANLLYNNNQEKLIDDMSPSRKNYEWVSTTDKSILSFNDFAKKATQRWKGFHLNVGHIKNYGGTNMKYVLIGEISDSDGFLGTGRIVFNALSGEIEEDISPIKTAYAEDIQRLLYRLHYGDYGGTPIKIIYFILSLVTCFVIITGVLIWIESRNKKKMTLRQRLYTAKIGHIYLAICLSMLPVTALSFLFVKISNGHFEHKQNALYYFYFITWLIAIVYFRFKRDNYFTNKFCLLTGSIFGFLIPISNGIVSGNWVWTAYSAHQFEILSIDILWIIIASLSLISYLKIKPEIKEQSSFTKNPIDYKDIKRLRAEEAKKIHLNTNKNYIAMRTKIIILWIFLGIGWIAHHVYGLFNIYYNETLIIDGATGEAPVIHHIYRVLFEGMCLLFGLLTIEVSKSWFKWTSLIWASIAGLYNAYHLVTALIYETSNISEIFMLLLVLIASIFLVKNLNIWKQENFDIQ